VNDKGCKEKVQESYRVSDVKQKHGIEDGNQKRLDI
jgi:hypothetical protein